MPHKPRDARQSTPLYACDELFGTLSLQIRWIVKAAKLGNRTPIFKSLDIFALLPLANLNSGGGRFSWVSPFINPRLSLSQPDYSVNFHLRVSNFLLFFFFFIEYFQFGFDFGHHAYWISSCYRVSPFLPNAQPGIHPAPP